MLRLVRALLNLRLSELSERSGVSVRELARIEKGEAQPSRGTLNALDVAVEATINARLDNVTKGQP